MFRFKHKAKAVMALVLACLLLISAIPVFAENSSEDSSVKIAVADPTFEGEAGATGKDGYPYYSTISAAIDSFNNAGGTVYVKGEISLNSTSLPEGGDNTTAGRGDVIIAGYDNSADGGKLTITETKTLGKNYLKGNLTFKNINFVGDTTIAGANGANNALTSGGYVLTMGEGIVSEGTSEDGYKSCISIGGYPTSDIKNQYFNIYSGTYRSVSPVNYENEADKKVTLNSVINIYGGTFNNVSAVANGISVNDNNKTTSGLEINGDVTINIYGGSISMLNFSANTWLASGSVKGDTVFNISGGAVTTIAAQMGHDAASKLSNYVTPEYGNIAVVIDAAKTTSATIGYGSGVPNIEYFKYAEGKVGIAIINNYTGSNCVFNTKGYWNKAVSETNPCVLNRYDYKLTVVDGEAHPVFERTNASDPSTSYLVGFTIESNTAGLTPYINGTKLTPVANKTTEDGKAIYDLTAYKSDREDASDDAVITNITFVDERPVVVSTDDSFNPTGYKKVATINEAIAALGANGGTVYIKGEYTITDMLTEFAETKNITSGKKVVITGYVDESTSSTADNVIYLGNTDNKISLSGKWLNCNLEFNNLKLDYSYQSESSGFNSNGYTLTLGDGLVTDFTRGVMGTIGNDKTNKIVINSGTYTDINSLFGWGSIYNKENSVEYTINGGTFKTTSGDDDIIRMGFSSNNSDKKIGNSVGTKGDITWIINGGRFEKVNGSAQVIRTNGRGMAYYSCRGVTRLYVNGGENLSQIEINAHTERNDEGTGSKHIYTNQVVVIDNSKVKNVPINSQQQGFGITKGAAIASGKKTIAIINNFEGDSNLIYNAGTLSYAIQVKGGEADAVFNGTGEAATFAGFTITPSVENEGKLAVVNGTDIVLPNDNEIYNLSAYEFGGIINITFVDGEDLTVIYEQYDNINAYRAEGNFTAPEKVGYVFGGWYSAANEDSAYTVETIKTGTVFYAKFVPEKILYAGVQITAGTNANSESTNIRLVSSVDNLKYLNVRFTLNRGTLGNDIVCTSDKVYEKITPYDNEGNELEGVKPSYIFGSAANYFTTHIITGVPNSAFNTELTLTASWQTKDGTWVNSGRKTIFSVSDVMDSLED